MKINVPDVKTFAGIGGYIELPDNPRANQMRTWWESFISNPVAFPAKSWEEIAYVRTYAAAYEFLKKHGSIQLTGDYGEFSENGDNLSMAVFYWIGKVVSDYLSQFTDPKAWGAE